MNREPALPALAFALALLASPARAQLLDLAEGDPALWGAFAQEGAPCSVSADSSRVKSGLVSMRLDTAGAFDTGVRYPAVGNANWNLEALGVNFLFFWVYAENTTPIGWQGNQPIVVLKSSTGDFRYEPVKQPMPNFAWRLIKIPLAGDDTWIRTESGAPTLSDIDQIEIHQDTWDAGFTVWYDAVRFVNFTPGTLPPPGPTPPAGVDADAVNPKVLLYIIDPVMTNLGGLRMHEAYAWGDPVQLTNEIVADFQASSHGRVNFQIVETVDDAAWPYLENGFQYTPETYHQAITTGVFEPGTFDYARFIQDHSLGARADAGEIDEVWVYSFPGAGMFESAMAGHGAYWVNGGPYPNAGGDRAFVIMGWNFERGVGEAIHSFGHRSESIMADKVYGQWCQTRCNTWSRFALLDINITGQGGVGNVHYPVNGEVDYDYANLRFVLSNADAWMNYPNLDETTRLINYREWSPNDLDQQREYLNWWYAHMPHVGKKAPDQYLANWWRYLCDVDQFKTGNANLYYASGEISVAVTTPIEGAIVSGVVPVRAFAEADGALGRADLYADGALVESDSIAPFTFEWDTAPLAPGQHTLVVKAYELQNGTEAVSAPVHVVIAAPCPGDANGDGVVNFTDLNIVLSFYGLAVPPGQQGDLNGDGAVTFADLNIVLSAFGTVC